MSKDVSFRKSSYLQTDDKSKNFKPTTTVQTFEDDGEAILTDPKEKEGAIFQNVTNVATSKVVPVVDSV